MECLKGPANEMPILYAIENQKIKTDNYAFNCPVLLQQLFGFVQQYSLN